MESLIGGTNLFLSIGSEHWNTLYFFRARVLSSWSWIVCGGFKDVLNELTGLNS